MKNTFRDHFNCWVLLISDFHSGALGAPFNVWAFRRPQMKLSEFVSKTSIAVVILLGVTHAQAQTVWNPGTTTDYNTATNWTPNNVPNTAGETALFNNLGTQTAINVSAAVAPDAWTFATNAKAYSFTGSTVTLATGLTNSATANNIVINNVIAGAGSLTQNGTQSLTLSGINTYTGNTFLNNGNITVTSTGSITSNVIGNSFGLGTFNNNGTVNGNLVANTNVVTNNGTWNGNLDTSGGGGGFTMTNNNIWRGDVSNPNARIVNNGTWTTTAAGIKNGFEWTNNAGSTIDATAGGFTNTVLVGTNSSGGILTGAGHILGNVVNTNGGIIQSGNGNLTITGSLTNSNGATINIYSNNIAVTGPINNTSAIAIGGAEFSPFSPGLTGLTLGSVSTVTNASGGIIDMNGATLVGVAGIINAGTINVRTATSNTLTGNVTNSGTLNMVADTGITATQNRITINGTLTGNAGNVIRVPVNLTTGAVGQLTATGSASGTNNVLFVQQNSGALGLFSPVTVTTTGSGSNTFVYSGGLPTGGMVNYSYQTSGPNVTQLTSAVNPAPSTAPMISILSSLAAIETSFHQPTSALIDLRQSLEPNKWTGGMWSRVSGGDATVTSNGSASFSGTTTTAQTRNDVRFSGYQIGFDSGLLNVAGSGWNVHAGLTGGEIQASATESLRTSGSVKFNAARFVGAYAVFDRGGFYSDIGYRHSTYDASVTNVAAGLNGINGGAGGVSNNVNASLGYRVRTSSYFIEPSAGLSWTRSNFDGLAAIDATGLPYTLAFNTFNSLLGRVGVGGGPSFVLRNRYVVEPFVSGSLWHEFIDNAGGVFTTGTSTALLSTDRIGSFYQLGTGVSAHVLNTGALGFVRSDFRFGDKFKSWALLGGFRWTFDTAPEIASNRTPKAIGTMF